MFEDNRKIKYKYGQPCNHKGCLAHLSHPCEGCGRVGGEGIIYFNNNTKQGTKDFKELLDRYDDNLNPID